MLTTSFTAASTLPSSLCGSATNTRTTSAIYLHADMSLKEQALARTTPPNTRPGRYRPRDTLLAFLEGL